MTTTGNAIEVARPATLSTPEVRPPLGPLLARASGPSLLLLVAGVYLALAQLIIWLNDPVQAGASFWPAAGVSLGLLLVTNRRQWPWVLAGVAGAEVVGDLIHGYAPGAIALWTAGNVVEPLVGALLIQRFSSPRGALTPLPALLGFIVLGVVAAPLVGATIGSLGTIIFYEAAPAVAWPKYVVGDALGVLVVAPVLLTWWNRSSRRSLAETLSLFASAIAVTLLVFRNWDAAWDVTLPYLILPFLTWAGLRFGVRAVALLSFVIANIANAATAFGYGPFAVAGGVEHGVTLLQLFLAITLTSAFMLASLASDLMDSRELARRHADHNADVQRNREFRDAFVGVLSHEIRTPITTIYGMTELLRRRHTSMEPETVGQYLDDIGSESDRLRRLTEDLLVLSRAEGGLLSVAANPIALGHLVPATVESERPRWPGHRLSVDSPLLLPIVLGEDVYVEQVLRNFISNACKYSLAGTAVHVAVASEDGGVAVRVIDEGRGLPEGAADRVFDLFYRGADAIGTTPGAGVGLFICRELVRAMGGHVWAIPRAPAPGSEFGFWLPAADEDGLAAS